MDTARRLVPATLALLLSTVNVGCRAPRAVVSAAPAAPLAAFDSFWEDVDRTYPYFEHKQVDWLNMRTRWRDSAANVTSDSAFVSLLLQTVRPLRDVHLTFTRPDGTPLPSHVPEKPRNWNRAVWTASMRRLSYTDHGSYGWAIVDSVGYLFIGGWNDAVLKTNDVDRVLADLRETRALVIDVRANGGGNDALALHVAARFAVRDVVYGSVQYRNGPRHSDFGSMVSRTLKPRGPWTYSKPVYLLVGRGCFSSNETFIAAMSMLPNIVVAGDTTGGSSGNAVQRRVVIGGRDTGWRYAQPRWIDRMADGTVIEWNGIAPDVVVAFGSARVANGIDPVLEWALARARR